MNLQGVSYRVSLISCAIIVLLETNIQSWTNYSFRALTFKIQLSSKNKTRYSGHKSTEWNCTNNCFLWRHVISVILTDFTFWSCFCKNRGYRSWPRGWPRSLKSSGVARWHSSVVTPLYIWRAQGCSTAVYLSST